MRSQTSPKAQVIIAVLILAASFLLYLWQPNEQSENNISNDLSQVALKKPPVLEWQTLKEPELPKKSESYNQVQKQIQDLKQIAVEPLINLLETNKKDIQQNEKESLGLASESKTQETTDEKQSIYAVHTIGPDCYREGPAGPIGINVKATCCNCGKAPSSTGCDRYEPDCGHNGENCCKQEGCLNLWCLGKPAIWDPISGECGC